MMCANVCVTKNFISDFQITGKFRLKNGHSISVTTPTCQPRLSWEDFRETGTCWKVSREFLLVSRRKRTLMFPLS